MQDIAIVEEISPALDCETVLAAVSRLPYCLFLDSALQHPELGRYSFLTADPFEFIIAPADGSDCLTPIRAKLAPFQNERLAGLPPFQGGAAGLLSYDLGRSFERLPVPRYDEFQVPALAIGLYDVVIAFDHVDHRSWIVSQGFPELDPAKRRARAVSRCRTFQQLISHPEKLSSQPSHTPGSTMPAGAAPAHLVSKTPELYSNFTEKSYCQAVQRSIDYIYAGDVFQVNLSQRLITPARSNSLSLYRRLRRRNPATFAGYFDLGSFQIASASPERFLRVHDREVETRPIKGTRRRTSKPEADLFAGDDLRQSSKDRAENVMIVDLMRNDLSRVCDPASVKVTQLCQLETYEFVQHLVSAVRGHLADEHDAIDLLQRAFPGGSVTGAPKIRAMQIITELEQVARGAYCGSMGYLGFDGTMDWSILIRTITAGRGWWQLPVGGGVVAQSDPAREYDETWHKAEGMLRALSI